VYRIILKKDFSKFYVRHVKEKSEMVIAYCIRDALGDWVATNIISETNNLHKLLSYVKRCEELNKND